MSLWDSEMSLTMQTVHALHAQMAKCQCTETPVSGKLWCGIYQIMKTCTRVKKFTSAHRTDARNLPSERVLLKHDEERLDMTIEEHPNQLLTHARC